jgi:hypothetical protein
MQKSTSSVVIYVSISVIKNIEIAAGQMEDDGNSDIDEKTSSLRWIYYHCKYYF